MTSSSLLPPGSRSSSDSDSSDSSVGDVNVNRLNQSQGAISQTDDLVSVTIQKSSPAQKVGISLVERKNHVFVTNVAESGLFHGTDLKVGDKIISINGKRPNEGEGAKHILKLISKAKATVTIVVEKPKRKPRRRVISLSPMTQRKKKTMGKLRRNEANRKDDPRYVK